MLMLDIKQHLRQAYEIQDACNIRAVLRATVTCADLVKKAETPEDKVMLAAAIRMYADKIMHLATSLLPCDITPIKDIFEAYDIAKAHADAKEPA